jgi:hypothetical protein
MRQDGISALLPPTQQSSALCTSIGQRPCSEGHIVTEQAAVARMPHPKQTHSHVARTTWILSWSQSIHPVLVT